MQQAQRRGGPGDDRRRCGEDAGLGRSMARSAWTMSSTDEATRSDDDATTTSLGPPDNQGNNQDIETDSFLQVRAQPGSDKRETETEKD